MSEPAEPCDQCDGRGWWAGGCEGELDCFQCHGTGIARVRGNCELCLGWGWTVRAETCTACAATGSVNLPVALYWCRGCMRTIRAADDATAVCPNDADHAIERRTGTTR